MGARRLFTCVASITRAHDVALLIAMIDSVFRSLVVSFKVKRMKLLLVKSLPPCVSITQTHTVAQLCSFGFLLCFRQKKTMENGEETPQKKRRTLRDVQSKRPPEKRIKGERRRRNKMCGNQQVPCSSRQALPEYSDGRAACPITCLAPMPAHTFSSRSKL